jgi:hypothetical protein
MVQPLTGTGKNGTVRKQQQVTHCRVANDRHKSKSSAEVMRLAQELQHKIESWERAAAAGEARDTVNKQN